jgi:trehalose-phosphatase
VTTSPLPLTPDIAKRLAGDPLVLLLDVDGTLAPIAPTPGTATVPPRTRRVLEDLVKLPGVHISLVSGRTAADAVRLVDVPGVWAIGNHGFEVAEPGQPAVPHAGAAEYIDRIAAIADQLRALTRGIDGVTVEDKRWTVTVHYRLADRRILPALLDRSAALAHDAGLYATNGKEVFEVRPPLDVNKGTACLEIAERLGAFHEGASLLSAGDDRTDEDAFIALRAARPEFVTVRVQEAGRSDAPATAAEFDLPDPESFCELLEAIRTLRA